MTYRLEDFNRILEEGFTYELSQETKDMIEAIANQVGMPGYVCTPTFQKRRIEFKPPVKKQTSIIDDIRKNINKISDKTFEKIKNAIVADLHKAYSVQESGVENIANEILVIASGNAFYSNLYARLYKVLIETFDTIITPIEARGIFDVSLAYCDPNKDYDRFCEINKENETRRAIVLFYVNLVKEDTMSSVILVEMIQEIQARFKIEEQTPEGKPYCDELSELLFVAMTNSKPLICNEEIWTTLVKDVEATSMKKQSPETGITNKSIFKHMDIMDAISEAK